MSRTEALPAALLVVAACGGPKVTLRYHPPAGATYRFTLEQRQGMTFESGPMAALGTQQLMMRMHFTQSVTGPLPQLGGVEVRITFDSTEMEASGLSPAQLDPELARLRGLEATVRFDDRARVLSTDFKPSPGIPPELRSQMATGVQTMSFALPRQPVGRGDSWTITTDLPLGQLAEAAGTARGAAARTTLTVREIRIEGTPPDTVVRLAIETSFPSEPLQLDVGGRAATLRLSGTLTGDQTFSLTRGTIVRGDLGGAMRMQVSAGGVGAPEMTMVSDTRTSLRLHGAP